MTTQELMKDALLVCATLILSMIGWFLIEGQAYLNAAEVQSLISQKEQIVTVQLDNLTQEVEELKTALKDATRAINDLRVELAKNNE